MATIDKVCIIGRSGFIGGALAKRFKNVTSTPTRDCEVIFDFGSPVHPPFEENPDYYFKTLLERHLYFLSFGIYYVWPSSALVYEEKELAFTHFKRAMEEISCAYPNNLGLRIFPVFGPGESRTAISQWCKTMKEGKRPIVYGDGTQTRDFIFIEEAIDQILELVEHKTTGIFDIGTGWAIGFNMIIDMINEILGKNLKPIYKEAPTTYSEGIKRRDLIIPNYTIYESLKTILNEPKSR